MESSRYTVILPDIHQDHRFVEKVLERHDLRSLERLVFLGDYFDAKNPFFAVAESLERTLSIILRLIRELGDRVVLLLGNHDVLYYFNREDSGLELTDRKQLYSYYGLPNRETLKVIASLDLTPMWERIVLAHLEQGFLCSHAGVTLDFWSRRRSIDENMDRLNRLLPCLLDAQGDISPLFRAGFARGGDAERGGPLWLDWNQEFSEEIGIPQIVGHTVGVPFRKQGRSYCLDAQQQGYGLLNAGELRWVGV